MKLCYEQELILINISFFLLSVLHSSCLSLDSISPSQSLRDGDILLSDSGTFAFGFFSPGNNSSTNRYVGIWYHKFSNQTVVWVANRQNPLNDTSGALSIDTHGNIVLLHNDIYSNQTPIWSSNISNTSSRDSFAKLQDSGNLVLITRNGGITKVLWQSLDYPSDTLLPFMKIGVDRRTGFNMFLTSWKSPDDPGLGSVSHRIDPTGYPQSFIYRNGAPFWRGGSWTGQGLSGVPEMIPNFNFQVRFIDNASEVVVMTQLMEPSMFLRMVLDNMGHETWTIWQPNGQKWLQIWYGPKEDCDYYRRCGSNSKCDPYNEDKFECVCLPGFEPVNPQEWNMRNGSSGCVRKKNMSMCQSGDGFVKVASVKVPDTSKARVNKSETMSLKGCEEMCLRDCLCVAYTSADVVSQSGCLTWHADMEDIRTYQGQGQDLYVRVDASELGKYESKPYGSLGKKGMVTLVVVSTCLILLVIVFAYWFVWNKKRVQSRHIEHVFAGHQNNDSDLPLFDLSDIIAATDNFSETNKLGQGGFGSVYKGLLNDEMTIAVKRLSKYSGQGIEEFKNEVSIIAKLQHRNLVKILGYCIHGEEKMLIYEYLPNKSLDSFLFDQAKKVLLDWTKRFDIICGVAREMLYLHQDSRLRIIHRDLKASNILLDSTLNPKIADFGMAKMFDGDQIEGNTNRIVGT
ncbi:G-type lectin S-receptor-like serine/threonine-protein kinase At1g11410 [Prosopis cineraria]|uniref:G-type lectin S-receptor-like serine/threonine-protein kinase At1g11410 n=1 Tax=Prosopis cineraria TaxID=364024 RepID=UPI00240FBFB6|nr:G-type lectin S-receptor-like serine/threonine-protein kinase At1g11410 [Prosopis cineraria]